MLDNGKLKLFITVKNTATFNVLTVYIYIFFEKFVFNLVVVSSWQFISFLISQHKKLDDRIKTTGEKGMQVTKQIDVKHTQVF